MFKATVLFMVIAAATCCEKQTFANAKIKASKYFTRQDDPDDIKAEEVTGCITGTGELKDAVQISVKNQQIPVVYAGAVQGLQWLHILKLEDDGIEEIKPGAFEGLPTLSTVSLAHNRIEEIPEGVFDNMEIKRLLLNDNRIAKIAPKAFDSMPNLLRIDLDRNQLQEWNSHWFTKSPNILYLSATFNQIQRLPARALSNIKKTRQGSLPSIYLANNQIREIDPKAFEELEHVEALDLDQNSIARLDDDLFAGVETIRYLTLTGNKITCLSEQLLNALPESELISLNDNPITCQCLSDMQAWARKKHVVNLKINIRKIECMQERIRNVLDSVKDIH